MTHAPRDGMMPLPRLTAPARSCDTDKVQRPPSWLQKKWIQALLAQAIDGSQQEPEQDAAEAVSSLMLTIAQLRHLELCVLHSSEGLTEHLTFTHEVGR